MADTPGGADALERICSIEGCAKPARLRGWCGMHHQRFLRHGDPLIAGLHVIPSVIEARFWAKVHKTPTCWLWTGAKLPRGYGLFGVKTKGKNVYVHRYAYELLVGPIPDGYTIDHVKDRGCTSTACVNPAHLEAVTMRENILRGDSPIARNARKTHCPKGHPLDGTNRQAGGSVTRYCRTCNREACRKRKAKRRTG